jgi:hypothetical protein
MLAGASRSGFETRNANSLSRFKQIVSAPATFKTADIVFYRRLRQRIALHEQGRTTLCAR